MKRTIPFFLLLVITGLTAAAQNQDDPFRKRTYLKVNPTTIINELDIYLEQDLSEKLSLELGVSGIYTDYPDFVFFKRVDIGQRKPGISTEQFVEGRGLGFRAGLKWYLFRRQSAFNAQGTYFQPVLFYKRVFYPDEDVNFENSVYVNSADKNVYGIQFLLGRQIKRDKFILDPYLGIGIRGKQYKYTRHNINGNTITTEQNDLWNVLPSLHLGIKVGLSL
ncbi:hypothetical protein ACFOTA_12955 [Chitinophaga sp. GCM10012297]|uniref:DUF3575 domain-containing protein n=1 Tax=Chitinophaga chungangae TaxID=2821488 RepID=A0ABS3YEL1_9BACT|nr:hypothetical protein [Chitinophaga chungangae]MBO9153121.1 hypothetical protein [Chitinophaga chungangae]